MVQTLSFVFFFFSSRRRHTRFSRDWSSDVCSSDLFYPKRELAAQVIGYVGTDDEGLSGIEREYEDKLHGKPGRMLISVDARRKYFGSVEKQPEPGENVVLTLDEQIQYIAE